MMEIMMVHCSLLYIGGNKKIQPRP